LFATLPTPALAGNAAARLFEVQTWVSAVLGLALLVASRAQTDAALARRAQAAIPFVLVGVMMALLAQYAVSPHIVARDNLRLWHTVGTAMYVVQWVCAAASFWWMVRPGRGIQP
jgi:hypothetical protein